MKKHIIAISLSLAILCCIFTACGINETAAETTTSAIATQSTTATTTQPTTKDTVTRVLSYNPSSMTVGKGVASFSHPDETGPWTLYLLGIENPEDITVSGWEMLEKHEVDTGLLKIVLNNKINGNYVLQGEILLEGRHIVTLHDGTPY